MTTVQDILKPVLYADIFDFPLTFEEIYRFLEQPLSRERTQNLLQVALSQNLLVQKGDYYHLPHRSELSQERLKRQALAEQLWPQALHYGAWIASLPFVRLVAVTGSLAVNNPRHPQDDIDYFIVTAPGRLWLCRALIIALVRLGQRQGVHLCPNYLITENVMALEQDDTNLYTAREMFQMTPLFGQETLAQLKSLNPWVYHYLPQGDYHPLKQVPLSARQSRGKRAAEWLLRGWLGHASEWLLQRWQIGKHSRRAEQYGQLDKVEFTPDVCKGHYHAHNQHTMTAYQQNVSHYASPNQPE